MSENPRLLTVLKILKDDGSVQMYRGKGSKRFHAIIKGKKFLKAIILVDYGGDIQNFGEYEFYQRKDLLFALSAFVEGPLVSYFHNEIRKEVTKK